MRSVDNLIYGGSISQPLLMDYYPPPGNGPHPAVIVIHGGGFVGGTSKNNSEAYCTDFLVPAGYAVFSINYRLAPKFSLASMIDDVERAVRFVRFNAKEWDVDPSRIALLGGSAGGYLSNMAGLVGGPGNNDAPDLVDRQSSAVQAVVTLYGLSDFQTLNRKPGWDPLFEPLSHTKGIEVAVAELSPIKHVTSGAPPFLLIHGDKDEDVPIEQSLDFREVLKRANVRCDLIVIHNGRHSTLDWHHVSNVPDWEKQLTQWLNEVLHHAGPIGEGVRKRVPL